jgi:hypothetical protein
MTENFEHKRKYLLYFIPICLVMAVVQIVRAFGGNSRSWVYVFEWPFFAIFLYYMYWKLGQPMPDWDDSDDPKREVD